MRFHRSMLATALLTILFPVALVACSSDTSGGSGGGGGAGGGSSGSVAEGEILVQTNGCSSCHTGTAGTLAGGDNLVSGVYGPNLTPDPDTGLAGRTDDQIKKAISAGIDDEGGSLCASMPRYSNLTAQELTDIVAYLRSLPAVKNQVASGTCGIP